MLSCDTIVPKLLGYVKNQRDLPTRTRVNLILNEMQLAATVYLNPPHLRYMYTYTCTCTCLIKASMKSCKVITQVCIS